MYNWSTDTKELKKYPEKYEIWKLEQMINFGLQNQKINKKKLTKYWEKLNIDPARKKFLKMFL